MGTHYGTTIEPQDVQRNTTLRMVRNQRKMNQNVFTVGGTSNGHGKHQ